MQTPLVAPRVLAEDEASSAPPSFAESLERGELGEPGGAPPVVAPSEGWSILITRIAEGTEASAAAQLDRVRTSGGLPEAVLQRRRGGLVIAVGSFGSPTEERARRELQRVRDIRVGGAKPYAYAFFAPPTGEIPGTNPEWDLRNVRRRFGSEAEYTLQIGVYARVGGGVPSPSEVAEFRAAAEKAVAALRADGEQAFYFHGPTSSTVTVGVFSEDDHDSSIVPPIESMRLRETRERHPNNLVNGAGFRETLRTDTGTAVSRLQRSQLVQIPRN
ncbi:MAG: hypothetical protein ACIARR_05845 [Phycisphaerales bacterium JB059]